MFGQTFFNRQGVKIGRLFGLFAFLLGVVSAPPEEDEPQVFRGALKNGDFLRVVVWQKNADVSLKLFPANAESPPALDNSDSPKEPERISLIGEDRVEVRGLKNRKTPGRYEIRIEAEKLCARAVAEWFPGKPDAKSSAVKTFGKIFVHFYPGILYFHLNDHQKMLESPARKFAAKLSSDSRALLCIRARTASARRRSSDLEIDAAILRGDDEGKSAQGEWGKSGQGIRDNG